MPVPLRTQQRYDAINKISAAGWGTGTLLRHESGALVQLGVPCPSMPGRRILTHRFVLVDNMQRGRWHVTKIADECSEIPLDK